MIRTHCGLLRPSVSLLVIYHFVTDCVSRFEPSTAARAGALGTSGRVFGSVSHAAIRSTCRRTFFLAPARMAPSALLPSWTTWLSPSPSSLAPSFEFKLIQIAVTQISIPMAITMASPPTALAKARPRRYFTRSKVKSRFSLLRYRIRTSTPALRVETYSCVDDSCKIVLSS